MKFVLIFSPLSQFEVNSLLGFNAPILSFLNLSLTNLGLYTLLALFVILGLHLYGNNDSKLIPSKWSIAFESLFKKFFFNLKTTLILLFNWLKEIPFKFKLTIFINLFIRFIFCDLSFSLTMFDLINLNDTQESAGVSSLLNALRDPNAINLSLARDELFLRKIEYDSAQHNYFETLANNTSSIEEIVHSYRQYKLAWSRVEIGFKILHPVKDHYKNLPWLD
jgi:hypothetical protein